MSSPSLQEGKPLKHRAFPYLALVACKGLKTTLGAMSNLGKMAASSARHGGLVRRKYVSLTRLGPEILHVFEAWGAFLLRRLARLELQILSWPTS